MTSPAISVRGLTFAYDSEQVVLDDLSFELAPGTRCLLIGPNGAGKTTLLRVLGGKHMVSPDVVQVLGSSAFHDTSLASRVELLGGRFDFRVDLRVAEVVDGVIDVHPDRRARLLDVLGVDLDWHMHAVSDGQRRRVQLLLGLLRPADLLLLDEATTDLDLLARRDLLDFLREESEGRQTTIVYASHILDGLESWATHLAYMKRGRLAVLSPLSEIAELSELAELGSTSPLLELVHRWLKRDVRGHD